MIDRNGNEISNIVIQNNFFSDSKGIMINSLQSGLYKHNYGNLYLGWEGYKLQIINSNLTDSTSIDNTKYGGNTKLSSSDGLTVFGRLTAFTLASQEGDPSTLNKIFKIYGRYSVSPYPTMEIGNIKWKWGTSIPSSGTYNQGDIIFNISPTAGDYVGWICVTGGSPGTWKGFGLIET